MVKLSAIKDLADRIAREFHPDRVILFGSYAHGTATADSDVDLLIILRHEGKSWEAAAAIRGSVRPTFPVDLVVRSPEELRERLRRDDVFLREITEHGKVLHEAEHSRMGCEGGR